MVTPGSYIIVEDANVAGRPVLPSFPDDGPFGAVNEFLENNTSCVIDKSKEKYMATFNPNGFLLRLGY